MKIASQWQCSMKKYATKMISFICEILKINSLWYVFSVDFHDALVDRHGESRPTLIIPGGRKTRAQHGDLSLLFISLFSVAEGKESVRIVTMILYGLLFFNSLYIKHTDFVDLYLLCTFYLFLFGFLFLQIEEGEIFATINQKDSNTWLSRLTHNISTMI